MRSGLEVAREALAAARAQARRLGHASRAGRLSAAEPSVRATRQGGDPALRSGAAPDDRDPQLLGGSVDRLVSERGWTTGLAVGGVLARWPEVAGPEVAAHCRPRAYDEDAGELVVDADSTAWATQLRLLVPALQRRLDEELGAGVVRAIRVLGPAAPSWRRGALSVRGRGPRDTYG